MHRSRKKIKLSKLTQTQKNKYDTYSLISGYICKVRDDHAIIHRFREAR